jgi:predicted deacetylase
VTTVLAVAVHDVEPRSFRRIREIREWLLDHGVDRVTLLVIPAPERHPIGGREPALATWLKVQQFRGDAIAQHGLDHKAHARARWPRRLMAGWQGGNASEFPGLEPDEAADRVRTGRRLLEQLELSPRGFVAPGYAYTRALRELLGESFDWFADLQGIQTCGGDRLRAPALCLGSSTPLKRALSPAVVRALAHARCGVMRVDIHPADFDHDGHLATLEWLLKRAAGRDAVTYDDLVA